jgi:hypothetical protein
MVREKAFLLAHVAGLHVPLLHPGQGSGGNAGRAVAQAPAVGGGVVLYVAAAGAVVGFAGLGRALGV